MKGHISYLLISKPCPPKEEAAHLAGDTIRLFLTQCPRRRWNHFFSFYPGLRRSDLPGVIERFDHSVVLLFDIRYSIFVIFSLSPFISKSVSVVCVPTDHFFLPKNMHTKEGFDIHYPIFFRLQLFISKSISPIFLSLNPVRRRRRLPILPATPLGCFWHNARAGAGIIFSLFTPGYVVPTYPGLLKGLTTPWSCYSIFVIRYSIFFRLQPFISKSVSVVCVPTDHFFSTQKTYSAKWIRYSIFVIRYSIFDIF